MDIKHKLEEYITAEANDNVLYLKIANSIGEKFKEDFIKIAEDEKQHAFAFSDIYKNLYKTDFVPQIEDVKIQNLTELLFERVDDEKGDYRKYDKDSYSGGINTMLRYAFHRASVDENVHALTILKVLDGLNDEDIDVSGESTAASSNLNKESSEEKWLKSECEKDIDLMLDMQKVWSQHVWWTRSVIISILNDLPDTEVVVSELMKNPRNIGGIFEKFYGKKAGDTVTKLITEHLSIGGEIFKAIKDKDTKKVEYLEKNWYKNADDIAKALASLDKDYDEEEIKDMFYNHLAMTTDEAAYIAVGEYQKGVMEFNNIENEILKMADYLSLGIINR